MEIDRPRDEAQARELLRRLHARARRRAQGGRGFPAACSSACAPWPTSWSAPSYRCRSRTPAEARALLAWMHDGHFVFLGYRYYRLKRGRARDALVRDADSGLGILRRQRAQAHPAPIVLTGELRRQARAPELLVLTKANSTVDRASRELSRLRRREDLRRRGRSHRRASLPRPVDLDRLSQAARGDSAAAPQARAVINHFGLPPQSHDAKAVRQRDRDLPARRAVPGAGRRT